MVMSIKEQLTEDMKQAMRDKDRASLTTIRMLIDVIQKKEKDLRRDATEDEEIQVLQTFKKQNEESLEAFAQRGDNTKVQEMDHAHTIVQKYLPKQLSRKQVTSEIEAIIVAITTPNKGEVIKIAMQRLKGRADNKLISQVVTEVLA
jgi:uncharacterized protein YqeY